MSETLQHLILVRHGESEGDVRRAAFKRGEPFQTTKTPEQEEITARGIEQCRRAGLWIQEHIIEAYGLPGFDGCYVSSALRSEQSAVALDLQVAIWQEDNCLDERDRGLIRGLRKSQHQQLYPESYEQMQRNPLHWIPPGGKSIIPDVSGKVDQFLENIEETRTVLAVTHRDWMWAAQLAIEHLTEAEMLAVDTDNIHNGQVVEYASVDPFTGRQAPTLLWKRSTDPNTTTGPGEWHILPRVAELYPLAA